MKLTQTLLWVLLIINMTALAFIYFDNDKSDGIPNLIGTWSGKNVTISDLKGYKEWDHKVVHITEQKDRRFRGTFSYPGETKHFFGVIYPDNKSFTWVASDSRGYNQGRILGKNKISACYVESWDHATAGCATLERD